MELAPIRSINDTKNLQWAATPSSEELLHIFYIIKQIILLLSVFAVSTC